MRQVRILVVAAAALLGAACSDDAAPRPNPAVAVEGGASFSAEPVVPTPTQQGSPVAVVRAYLDALVGGDVTAARVNVAPGAWERQMRFEAENWTVLSYTIVSAQDRPINGESALPEGWSQEAAREVSVTLTVEGESQGHGVPKLSDDQGLVSPWSYTLGREPTTAVYRIVSSGRG